MKAFTHIQPDDSLVLVEERFAQRRCLEAGILNERRLVKRRFDVRGLIIGRTFPGAMHLTEVAN